MIELDPLQPIRADWYTRFALHPGLAEYTKRILSGEVIKSVTFPIDEANKVRCMGAAVELFHASSDERQAAIQALQIYFQTDETFAHADAANIQSL